eukprot:scaffold74742_cov29-Tisochrysis_lutea.AAC.6
MAHVRNWGGLRYARMSETMHRRASFETRPAADRSSKVGGVRGWEVTAAPVRCARRATSCVFSSDTSPNVRPPFAAVFVGSNRIGTPDRPVDSRA